MKLFFVNENVDLVSYYQRRGHAFVQRSLTRDGRLVREAAAAGADHAVPHDKVWDFQLKACATAATADKLYFATLLELDELRAALAAERRLPALSVVKPDGVDPLLAKLRIPRRLGNPGHPESAQVPLWSQLRALAKNNAVSLAMITPFSTALGDSLQFCTLARYLRSRLEAEGYAVRLDLFQRYFLDDVAAIYSGSGLFDAIRPLPAALATLYAFDGYIDLSTDYVPAGLPWIDGLLNLCGIPAEETPESAKRNQFAIPPAVSMELGPAIDQFKAGGPPLVLFHPAASTSIRSMPEVTIGRLLEELLAATDVRIITTVPVAFRHQRLKDLSSLSKSFQHFAYLISRADAFLSVDTAAYHVADAFNVPGVVVFTTVPSAARIRYYPGIAGVDLAPSPAHALFGLHFSENAEAAAEVESWWDEAALQRIAATFLDTCGQQLRARASGCVAAENGSA